jgi:hypothetical protein
MNCIGDDPSLFLQRVYSENSPQNCDATMLSPVRRAGPAFAESHYQPVHPELAVGRNMQCEGGNFKVAKRRRSQYLLRIDYLERAVDLEGARDLRRRGREGRRR